VKKELVFGHNNKLIEGGISHEKEKMQKEKKEVAKYYKLYTKEANMTCSELKEWAKNPCSFKASIGRDAIKRNILLTCTPKKDWKPKHIKEAKKAFSYLKRAKKIKSSKIVPGCGLTKNEIALKNWAFDIKK
jgi:hypothetical protein